MDFAYLTRFLDSIPGLGVPGADCLVYKDHQEVYRHSAGYADREAKSPITPDTLYYLYSTSKVITCAAALTLWEKGLFLLNDPVAEYLPEFREMTVCIPGTDNVKKAENPIRIVDLFTMSAGLTYNMNTAPIRSTLADKGGECTTRDLVRAIAQSPLIFEPGTRWNYSLCHDVLGALIEVASGKTFGEYLTEAIFDPVGMKDTGFCLPEEKRTRMATQYIRNEETGEVTVAEGNSYLVGNRYESGGAGLISSADDYMAFAEMLCMKGTAKSGARILSPRTVDMMRTNQLDQTRMGDFIWPQMAGYGYGLGVRTMVNLARAGGNGSVGEFGWGGAAGAYVLIDPDAELTVFYIQHMLNSLEPYIHPRIRNIVYSSL